MTRLIPRYLRGTFNYQKNMPQIGSISTTGDPYYMQAYGNQSPSAPEIPDGIITAPSALPKTIGAPAFGSIKSAAYSGSGINSIAKPLDTTIASVATPKPISEKQLKQTAKNTGLNADKPEKTGAGWEAAGAAASTGVNALAGAYMAYDQAKVGPLTRGTGHFGTERPDRANIVETATNQTASQIAGANMAVAAVATTPLHSIPIYGTLAAAGITFLAGALGYFGKKAIGSPDAEKKGDLAVSDYESAEQRKRMAFERQTHLDTAAFLGAKSGMKLRTLREMEKFDRKDHLTRSFKAGGAIGAVNIIPKGKLHKEKNTLGNGDKGIPVVDDKGVKMFELEKEELILRLKATEAVENLVSSYNDTKDDAFLEKLGRLVTSEVTGNTDDLSGKFNETESR